jgi:hypothetical protein
MLPILGILIVPLSVAAQQPSGVYVTPYIGVTFPVGTIGLDLPDFPAADISTSAVFGGNLGYRMGSGFAIEGMLVYISSNGIIDFNNPEGFLAAFHLDALLYGGNLTYYFGGEKTAVVPFVTGGAGGINWSTGLPDDLSPSNSELFFDLGIGLEIPISEKIYLRYTLIDYFTSTSWDPLLSPEQQPDESSSVHYISLLAGMSFYF